MLLLKTKANLYRVLWANFLLERLNWSLEPSENERDELSPGVKAAAHGQVAHDSMIPAGNQD